MGRKAIPRDQCGRSAVNPDPLSFGYSVVRYRLMDVELVVRRVLPTRSPVCYRVGPGRYRLLWRRLCGG